MKKTILILFITAYSSISFACSECQQQYDSAEEVASYLYVQCVSSSRPSQWYICSANRNYDRIINNLNKSSCLRTNCQ